MIRLNPISKLLLPVIVIGMLFVSGCSGTILTDPSGEYAMFPTYQDVINQAFDKAGIDPPVARKVQQFGTYYEVFPTELRGTSMSREDQLEYFCGNMVLESFGGFGDISVGLDPPVTGCDVYGYIYEAVDYWDIMMQPIGGYLPYMIDVQETNRFGIYGPGGYDVPDELDIEVPCY